MKKDKIFFDVDGLTVTSANHVANMAKELYSSLEIKLNKAVFYTTQISLLGSSDHNTLKEGVDSTFLVEVQSDLEKIAKLKSLIAWLREAIKAKDRLTKEVSNLTDSEIAAMMEITLPEKPTAYPRITEDDVISEWNIKQRNRYYYLDTLCSTIGGYIHPNRGFSSAKEDFDNILTERNKAVVNGRDTIIYTYIPTVSSADVENTFFNLQKEYRGYQAELNSMKHQIETALQNDDREKTAKEAEESNVYYSQYKAISSQIRAYKLELLKDIQNLKIIIPDSLKDVYDTVKTVSK